MRKWTVPKLTALIEDPGVVRKRIHSTKRGALTAGELLDYLKLEERIVPDWKKRQVGSVGTAKKKKKTRAKTKVEKAAKSASPKPVLDPKKALAAAAGGQLITSSKKASVGLKPKAKKASLKRPVFKKFPSLKK